MMKDVLIVGGAVLVVTCASLLVVTLAVYPIASAACGAKWSDFENDFGLFSGCRVKVDGKWIPEDRIRKWEE